MDKMSLSHEVLLEEVINKLISFKNLYCNEDPLTHYKLLGALDMWEEALEDMEGVGWALEGRLNDMEALGILRSEEEE